MLKRNVKYLQIALNGSLEDARNIIFRLPPSPRIIIEAGTPLLKEYGADAIRKISYWWQQRLFGPLRHEVIRKDSRSTVKELLNQNKVADLISGTYIVADYKAMDRGVTEVGIAKTAGADAITVLGQAPPETIDVLIEECERVGIDSIIDMMNVDKPYQVLRKLKKLPTVVMLHRGVDETDIGTKPLPIHMINKVKGAYNVRIAIGGGDKLREVQSAFFNGADIVMLWRDFYRSSDNTTSIAEEFLKQVK